MMNVPSFVVRPALFVLVLALAGCTTPRTPLVLDETLRAEDVDEVLVLPVIDARPERFKDVLVSRNVGDAMVRFLRERGYFTLAAERFEQRPTGPLDLHAVSSDELVALAPQDARYFILVQVERLEPGTNEGAPVFDARLSAVMVDRPGGRVVWRDVATASSSLNGFLTVFSRGSRQYEAAVNASRALVETLPKKQAEAE